MKRQVIIVAGEPQRQQVLRFVSEANLIGRPLKVTIEDHKKTRSLSQNALQWVWLGSVVDIVGDELGYDAEDLHQIFKERFLEPTIIEIAGQVVKRWSTKKLDVAQMAKYLDQIYRFCTQELGLVLPIPEDRMVR